MPMTTYYAAKVAEMLFGLDTLTPEAHWHLALCLTVPTADVPGTEPTGGVYARLQVTNDDSFWTDNADGSVENTAITQWLEQTSDLGDIAAIEAYDAANAEACWWLELDQVQTESTGQTPTIAAGGLKPQVV